MYRLRKKTENIFDDDNDKESDASDKKPVGEQEWDLFPEISISSGDCIGIQVNKKFDCVTFYLNRRELMSVTFPRKKEIWPTIEIHGGESVKIHPCGRLALKDL